MRCQAISNLTVPLVVFKQNKIALMILQPTVGDVAVWSVREEYARPYQPTKKPKILQSQLYLIVQVVTVSRLLAKAMIV